MKHGPGGVNEWYFAFQLGKSKSKCIESYYKTRCLGHEPMIQMDDWRGGNNGTFIHYDIYDYTTL